LAGQAFKRKGYPPPMRMLIGSSAPIALGCILILTPALEGCDGPSREAKEAKHRELAANYFEKGQYQEAVIEYQNVTQIDPKNNDAHYRLALAYLQLGGSPNQQRALASGEGPSSPASRTKPRSSINKRSTSLRRMKRFN